MRNHELCIRSGPDVEVASQQHMHVLSAPVEFVLGTGRPNVLISWEKNDLRPRILCFVARRNLCRAFGIGNKRKNGEECWNVMV